MTGEDEPNGYELMRGLNEVKRSIDDLKTGFVSQQLFVMYQQTQADQDKMRDSLIQKIETDIALSKRERARVWSAIGVAILTALAGVVVGLLTNTPYHP